MSNEDYYFNYFVIFNGTTQSSVGPILSYSNPNDIKVTNNGTMHLFDEELHGTLKPIEYLMHLPRNVFDVYNMDEHLMGASYDTPHHITVLPHYLLSESLFSFSPTMIVLTNNCSEKTKQLCEQWEPLAGVYYSNELDEKLLIKIWRTLWENCKSEEYSIVPDIDVQHMLQDGRIIALPTLFLARQFSETDNFLSKVYNSVNIEKDIIQSHWHYLARLNSLISMSNQGIAELNESNVHLYKDEIKKEIENLHVSVVITFPGIPVRQTQLGSSSNVLSDK